MSNLPRHRNDDESNEQLGQSLIAPVDLSSASPTIGTPIILVTAPETLPEDYTFDAKVNNNVFSVTVPKGGIEKGQSFTVPLPTGANDLGSAISRVSVPTGQWKDGLLECPKHGLCHPILCNSVFFPAIANAQVMTRMKLNWKGKPGSIAETSRTFKCVLFIVITTIFLDSIILYAQLAILNRATHYGLTDTMMISINLMSLVRLTVEVAYIIYTVVSMMRARHFMRSKYAIPEVYCRGSGMEDFLCVVCCYCCSVAQMARHTADYDTYRGVCCSENGIPDHVPSIV